MDFRGKTVIVTGASAGIGRATAVALLHFGANVVVTARRGERLEQLQAQTTAYPGNCLIVAGDIRDEAFGQRLVAEAVSAFGRVDVLVNNAGLGHHSLLAETSMADLQTIMATNVIGLLSVTQAAVAQMKQQGSGQIVNVSSILGQRPLPHSVFYAASKTAVNFISRGLRLELRPHRIIVTTVYPGLTATEFGQARLGRKGINRFGLKGVPPTKVARTIVKAIDKGKTEVYISWYDWLFAHLNRLFPGTIDWVMGRIVGRF